MILDEKGVVQKAYDYYPFGLQLQATQAGHEATFTFTNKQLDEDGGLDWYYFGARFYDAEVGRFLGVDPLEEQYPGWSPYNYAACNPINIIDPNGLYWSMTDSGEAIWVIEETLEVTYDQNTGKTTTDTKLGTPLGVYLTQRPVNTNTGEYINLDPKNITNELIDYMKVQGFNNEQNPLNLGYVLKNSPTTRPWDIKQHTFTDPYYVFGNSVISNEALGNMAWGYIMKSGMWAESVSKMGAGAFQLLEHFTTGKKIGSIKTFFDQSEDYRAIGYGYKLPRFHGSLVP